MLGSVILHGRIHSGNRQQVVKAGSNEITVLVSAVNLHDWIYNRQIANASSTRVCSLIYQLNFCRAQQRYPTALVNQGFIYQ